MQEIEAASAIAEGATAGELALETLEVGSGEGIAAAVVLNPTNLDNAEADPAWQAQRGAEDAAHAEEAFKAPEAGSGGAMKGGKRGGENPDAARGREKHAEFSAKAKAKGWQTEPRLKDPATGKQVKPDAVTKSGRPVELKPRTRSGRRAGKRQLRKYQRATGKKGRVIYYD